MHSRGVSGVAVLAMAMLGAAPASAPLGRDLVVVRDGSSRTVPVVTQFGYQATPAAGLAASLGYTWQAEAMVVDGATLRFVAGSPFFSFGDKIHQLPNPVYRYGSQLMVPVSWALDWLPGALPSRWRSMDGRLVELPAAPSGSSAASRTDGRSPWLVVIDAGHGGADPGAIGVNGTREKDVTLRIARLLQERLKREHGVTVVMTRDRDTLVALADRPRVPQLRGYDRAPDLFLSIHGNSMPKKPSSTRGFETYFLAVAKTSEARQVAMRENQSLKFESDSQPDTGELDPLQFMLSDLESAGNLRESSLLATSVNRSMRMTLSGNGRGVKQAGFWVLVGASMPAALVEVGYLSNPSDERQLRSSTYQAKIADALADGIMNYLVGYGQRVWSSQEAGG